MNQFTKEELQDLLIVLNQSIAEGTEPECIHVLRDKIQSMIDNYAEFKPPTIANYCCGKCNEGWNQCECKNE